MPKITTAIANRRLLWWHMIALMVFFIDQMTKTWAVHALSVKGVVSVFPGFNFSLAFNQGAAFSMLADGAAWQRMVLIAFAVVMMGVLLWWLHSVLTKEQSVTRVIIGLGLLFGGALGNLLDRIETGRVVDFIQWYYKSWYWPTFNVADMAICVGIGLLALDIAKAEPAQPAATTTVSSSNIGDS
ncbi:MAG: hypothetical protein RLZ35_156 [Pseudomonadota bacterium]|jgi:signal peptidase II